MKIATGLALSLLAPQALVGLMTTEYVFGNYANEPMNSQTITIGSGEAPKVEKENYLLDVDWPVQEYWKRTSLFGNRWIYNCRGCSTFHQGVDFVPGEGRAVYSIMDGEIVDVGWDGSYGYRVVIKHIIHQDELEYTSIYAHLQESFISSSYKAGDTVFKGDIIGSVGSTGLSTGPHLHFEIHRNSKVLDPMEFFDRNIVN